MMRNMTKLLRLPAIVLMLTAAACETPSHTTEAPPAALERFPPCTASDVGATACAADDPAVLFGCQLLPVDLDSGVPPIQEEWEFLADCVAPTHCISAPDGSTRAMCATCWPGTSSCDNGNLVVCDSQGTSWLPAGTCRANACQCGGKYPHCTVCN